MTTPAYFGYAAASRDLHHSQQSAAKKTRLSYGGALATGGVITFFTFTAFFHMI
jgi:hypothetical protein